MARSVDPLSELEERLGYRFTARDLLLRALTHISFANEHPGERHNESLAFVGDSVLSLIVAERLWQTARDEPVGVLTPDRASVVADENLARWADDLNIGALLRLGRGEELTGGRTKQSVLATAFEAILGAVYLESGLGAARAVVARAAMW